MQSLKVLGCSTSWISACLYLRLLSPLRAVGGQLETDLSDLKQAVESCDLVFFNRQFPADEPEKYAAIVSLARSADKPIVYETDDLLIDLPKEHPEWRHYSSFKFRYVTAMLEANWVLVTNEPLKNAVKKYNENVLVIPNYLDDSMWNLKDLAVVPEASSDEAVIIGYMGTVTHANDLHSIEPVLVSLLNQYAGKVKLKLWGVEPVGRLQENKYVEHIANCPGEYNLFVPFFAKQKADIFVAPLTQSHFNQCKSFLKYLEYSTLSVPGVYSRGTQYETVITDGANGLLAGNLLEWHKQLSALIEDRDLRVKIGRKAFEDVRTNWLLSSHVKEIREAFEIFRNQKRESLPDSNLVKLAKEASEWAVALANAGDNQALSGDSFKNGSDVSDVQHRREIEKMKQRLLRLRAELTASQRHAAGLDHLVQNLTQSWAWRVGKAVTGPARNLRQVISKKRGKSIEISRHV
ncbi:MAG TPA: glycosyltransferase [Oculatellaceae cyanobacterium]